MYDVGSSVLTSFLGVGTVLGINPILNDIRKQSQSDSNDSPHLQNPPAESMRSVLFLEVEVPCRVTERVTRGEKYIKRPLRLQQKTKAKGILG